MSLKILIADDNDSIRHRVRSCIESRTNWHVCGEAADGNLAVTLVRQLRPEIAVLDFSMPGLNGLEAAHEISSVSPNTKIVLFTVYGSEQLAKYARG